MKSSAPVVSLNSKRAASSPVSSKLSASPSPSVAVRPTATSVEFSAIETAPAVASNSGAVLTGGKAGVSPTLVIATASMLGPLLKPAGIARVRVFSPDCSAICTGARTTQVSKPSRSGKPMVPPTASAPLTRTATGRSVWVASTDAKRMCKS